MITAGAAPGLGEPIPLRRGAARPGGGLSGDHAVRWAPVPPGGAEDAAPTRAPSSTSTTTERLQCCPGSRSSHTRGRGGEELLPSSPSSPSCSPEAVSSCSPSRTTQ